MHNHWDKNLKVKDLVKKYKPKHILEMGAGGGENTKQYLEFINNNVGGDMFITVISDGSCPQDLEDLPELVWINHISYVVLKDFQKESVDFCSIDTDHNYWTLREELKELNNVLKVGGVLVIHDTETYKKNSGKMAEYSCNYPYPIEKIEKFEKRGKGMADAMYEAIDKGYYKIIKQVEASCGATALEKLK